MFNRRAFLKAGAIGAAATAVPAFAGSQKEPARPEGPFTGVVRSDRPFAGAVVSDGLNCAKTDEKGRFTLPGHPDTRFIALTVPAGWRVERHYVPVDAAVKSYDFTLLPWPRGGKDAVSFVHLADSEISDTSPKEQAWAAQVKRYAADESCAFIVHTGDICYPNGLRAHIKLMNSANMACPTFYTIGNHDLVGGKYGEALFESLYGPSWFSFDMGRAHFVATPMRSGDHGPSYNVAKIAKWLKNDLALVKPGTPVVFFNHSIEFLSGAFVLGSGADAVDLKAHNLTAFVYGHWHYNYFRRVDGVATICTGTPQKGGIDQSPASIRVVHIDAKGRATSTLHYGHAWPWKPAPGGAATIDVGGGSAAAPLRSAPLPGWATPLGAPVYLGSPVLDGRRLYVGTLDDDGLGTGGVTALDAVTGQILWRAATVNSVKNQIVLAAGKIVAQDAEGFLYGFDAATGASAWKLDLKLGQYPVLDDGLAADAEKGIVFAGSGGCLTAVDAATGRQLWRGGHWGQGEGSPVRLAFGNGVVIGAANWHGLYGNDAATGKRVWALDRPPFRFRAGAPRILGGKALICANDTFAEFETATGKVLREKKLGFSMFVPTTPLAVGGRYVFGSADEGVVALDAATLEVAWKAAVGPALAVSSSYTYPPQRTVATAPVLVGGAVAAAASDGTVRVLAPEDGRELGRIGAGAPYFNAPVADPAGRALFAADFAGVVRAFAC